MDAEYFRVVATAAQALTATFAAVIAVFSYKIARQSLEQTEQNVYLKLYEIIQRHHTQEITDLKGCIYTPDNKSKLAEVRRAAEAASLPLKAFDSAFHSKVCALANYFESIGMFLEYRWEKMPAESKTMMLAMLHNSVTKTWPEIYAHRDFIYPNGRPSDWAQSFQWLHTQAENYRRDRSLA